ncbi:MAG: phosphoglycerate mutase family protein, partial [Mycobacterium sp.]
MQVRRRCCATAGVALVGASVIAVAPTTALLPDVYVADIQLTAGDEQNIVIDILRHGQMISPFENELTPSPAYPGAPLSDLGQQQAQDVANQLNSELGDHVAGIFSGQAIRDIDTAAPFVGMEAPDSLQILSGLNELDSGIYAGASLSSFSGFLYELTPLLWTVLGLVLAPIPGSVED